MRLRTRVPTLALLIAAVLLHEGNLAAQNLPFLLFERYLEPLRISAGIPGLSATIVHDGQILWERGFGLRDIESNHPATPSTPYLIGDLTQTITSSLVLYCAQRGLLQLDDPIGRWAPGAQIPSTPLWQLLAHANPNGNGFRYAPARFAQLARPAEACFEQPFRRLVAVEVFDRMNMRAAIPGYDIGSVPPELRQLFDEPTLVRYANLVTELATPYRVDRRARATRNDVPITGVDGANGLIASARDLAEFDRAPNQHLRPDTLEMAWTNATYNGSALPTGLGWFVQTYNGEKLVWHFGYVPDAYSALMLKIPGRRLTLILLANSDGLSAPFALHEGDVTSSLFARTFLRLFL